jgi:hypothetical protein
MSTKRKLINAVCAVIAFVLLFAAFIYYETLGVKAVKPPPGLIPLTKAGCADFAKIGGESALRCDFYPGLRFAATWASRSRTFGALSFARLRERRDTDRQERCGGGSRRS